MEYLNPFDLIGISFNRLEEIDVSTIRKARKQLLADIELSETKAITINNKPLSKSECIVAFEELEDGWKKELHFAIHQDKELNKFLSNGSISFFLKFKEENVYKSLDFIEFISPYFAFQYNRQLSHYFRAADFYVVKLMLSVTPLVKEQDLELCYKDTYRHLKDIEQDLADIFTKIDKKQIKKSTDDCQDLVGVIKKDVKVQLINILPGYFQNIRNQIANNLKIIAIEFNNNYENYKVAHEIITLSFQINTTGLIEESVKKNYLVLKDNRENQMRASENSSRTGSSGQKEPRSTTKPQEKTKPVGEPENKYGKPITSAPSLRTLNGVGTTIYGDTLYFVFFFIPLFPISRYSLEYNAANKTYRFFSRLKLHKWQSYWQWAVGIAITILIIYSLASNSENRPAVTNTTPPADTTKSVQGINATTINPPPLSPPLLPEPSYVIIAMKTGSISGCSKIRPKYDYNLDNELKVTVDNNTDVALKLINAETGRCIRFVYIKKNTTYSIRNIPEGKYYTKIAYGNDWEVISGEQCSGRFSSDVSYKKSSKIVDFNLIHTADGTQIPSFTLRLYTEMTSTLIDDNQQNSVSEDDFNND